MKIIIDLSPLHGRKWTGVELYAIDLYKALKTTEHTIIPIFHAENDLESDSNAIIIRRCNRILLENFYLSKTIREIDADIVIFPIFPPPIDLYINKHFKIITVIHDTAFIEHPSTLKFSAKYYLRPKYRLALNKSNYIVTISEDAKQKIEKYSKLAVLNWKENISSDYKCENLNISIDDIRKFGLIEGNYYISVSTIEPRKNLKYLLYSIKDELNSSGKKLVLVGRKGWGNDKELNNLLKEMNNNIIFTDYIPLNMLQSLYCYAYAFILLSIEEGFGRTPLEAIACGCKKIIVSDISIFHETLHESANYIPLSDVNRASNLFLKNSWKDVESNFIVPFNEIEKSIYFL